MAEAGFGDRLGPKAAAAGALVALVPDLDMIARLWGDEWSMLAHHRGITHSLLAAPALAAVAGYAGWRWSGRSGRFVTWVHLALWALVTHSLLDWCTSYGTMLLYPLSSRRFALDAVAIVDPLYSIPLFVGLGISVALRRKGRSGRAWAAGTLVATTLYLVLGLALTLRAVSVARDEFAREGFEAVRVRASPHIVALPLRRVAARDERRNIRAGAVSPFSGRVLAPARIDWPDHPLVAAALETEQGRLFDWFALGLLAARVEPRGDGGTDVLLIDQRYGFVSDPAAAPFAARFEFDAQGSLRGCRMARSLPSGLAGEAAAALRALVGVGPASAGRER